MKIDVLFGGWLKAPNGAASVVNSLKEHRKSFEETSVEIEFWSLDNIKPREFNYSNKASISFFKKLKNNLKIIIKKFISKYAQKSIFLAKKNIYRSLKFSEMVALDYLAYTPKDNTKVLVHDIFTCYYYLKNRKSYNPTILVLHNNGNVFSMFLEYYPCLNKSNFFHKMKEMKDFVLNNVDKILFVAENPMNLFLQLNPNINKDKVDYIHNGIKDISVKREKTRSSKIIELVCVGSVSTRKGQDLIIEALKNLSNTERKKLHITIVGDGPLKMNLENICSRNDLPITFIGYSKEIEKYLLKSDIFLLPSRDEGFPISILEAERAGLPIISTNIAGIPEMVENGINGILINPTAKELYEIFSKIENYDWKLMGKKSKEVYQKRFTIEKMINNYIKILNEV